MQDVKGVQIEGVSLLGDRFRTLSDVYLCADPRADYIVPLAQLVHQIFVQYPGFQRGRQEDAEECLGQLLKGIDGSYAARDEPLPSSRVFGAPAEAGEANIFRCPVPTEAQVSALSDPIDVCDTLEKSLRGDLALSNASPALLVRMENLYDAGNVYYHVDVKVSWSRTACDLACSHGSTVRYQVAALVIYRHAEGHYVAFIHSDNTWYLANDMVYRTSTPPTEYPYILVLVKDEAAAARVRPRLHGQGVESLGLQPSALSTLLQKRVHLQRETDMPIAGGASLSTEDRWRGPISCRQIQLKQTCRSRSRQPRRFRRPSEFYIHDGHEAIERCNSIILYGYDLKATEIKCLWKNGDWCIVDRCRKDQVGSLRQGGACIVDLLSQRSSCIVKPADMASWKNGSRRIMTYHSETSRFDVVRAPIGRPPARSQRVVFYIHDAHEAVESCNSIILEGCDLKATEIKCMWKNGDWCIVDLCPKDPGGSWRTIVKPADMASWRNGSRRIMAYHSETNRFELVCAPLTSTKWEIGRG